MPKKSHTTTILLSLITLVWIGLSWQWYTCGVKGFCLENPFTKASLAHNVTEYEEEYDHNAVEEEIIIIQKEEESTPTVTIPVLFQKEQKSEIITSCTPLITQDILYNEHNNPTEVTKLEQLLQTLGYEHLSADGLYDARDRAAVLEIIAYYETVFPALAEDENSQHVTTAPRALFNTLHCALTE